jgi:hypothetical protein
MGIVDFHGVKIEPGAGIGRLEKDKALRKLLEELGIKWQEFPVTHNYSPVVYNSLLSNGVRQTRLGRIGRIAQKVEVPAPTNKLSTPDWIKKQIGKLQMAYKKTPVATTFHAFAQKVLGRTGYQQLVLALGYIDFEKEDVAETLFHYGLDDLFSEWTGMGIDWQELMDTLVEHSFADIRLNTRVSRISLDHDSNLFKLSTTNQHPTNDNHSKARTLKHAISRQTHRTVKNTPSGNPTNLQTSNSIGCSATTSQAGLKLNNSGQEFRARKVLIATTIGPARELVSNFLTGEGLRMPVHLSGVQSQSFLRIYGYFTGESYQIMKKYCQHTLVVPGGYHRIIPMGSSKNDGGSAGVYMIVYTDNRAADNLEHLRENTPINRQILASGLKQALGIPTDTHLEIAEILGYYWREGTHYYTPLNLAKFGSREDFIRQLQRPYNKVGEHRLFLAGEAFSRQQGWTEGALESIDAVLGDLL